MPLVLDIDHPAAGRRRIELIEPRTAAALKIDGEILPYYPGGPPRPEVLFIGAGSAGASFTAVGELTLQHKELRPQLPNHNGTRKEKGPLASGDVLHWHDHTVTVHATRQPTQEEWAMVEAARTNSAALLVYADWLETKGEKECAEWARLSLQDTPAAKTRMAELSARVGVDFRALVARGPVERCWKKCTQRWADLALLSEPWSRTCHTCSNSVKWCGDTEGARALRGGPVVLDPTTPRKPGDLIPPPMPVG
jgi:uncharacterized protein (TIGR02996 family)